MFKTKVVDHWYTFCFLKKALIIKNILSYFKHTFYNFSLTPSWSFLSYILKLSNGVSRLMIRHIRKV